MTDCRRAIRGVELRDPAFERTLQDAWEATFPMSSTRSAGNYSAQIIIYTDRGAYRTPYDFYELAPAFSGHWKQGD